MMSELRKRLNYSTEVEAIVRSKITVFRYPVMCNH